MQFPFVSQVSLSVAKISVDATPGLVGDIKQLLIKILLPPAVYVNDVLHTCF
jgi:puromycin-sensitive aminopeptidase